MVIEKGFWPFRTAQIILDDDAAHVYAQKKGYGRIVAITRTKLDLPVFSTKEKPTVVIDLTRSEEEIFTSMSYENRHKIRKSEQDGNLAFKAGDSDFEKAYALYLSFQKARGSRPFPRSYFSKSVLFSCSIAGEMISAIFVDMSKPHLRVRYIFSKRLGVGDKEEYRRINIASRRLVWEVCKWGKSNGYETLDLAGVNFRDPAKAGITEFKMSFGGNVATEYTYTRTSTLFSWLERMTRLLRR